MLTAFFANMVFYAVLFFMSGVPIYAMSMNCKHSTSL